MVIIKGDEIVENEWTVFLSRDAASHDENSALLITPADWHAHGETLTRFHRLGIRFAPEDAISVVSGLLDRAELVVLEFPRFSDGRGFSQARLLRDQYRFTGEIRATGHILRDQFRFLQRSGVDAVEVDDPGLLAVWVEERSRFAGHYQPAFDDLGFGIRPSSDAPAVPPRGRAAEAAWAATWAY